MLLDGLILRVVRGVYLFFIGETLTEYFGIIDSGLVTFLRYPKCGRGNPPRAVSSLKLLVRPLYRPGSWPKKFHKGMGFSTARLTKT